MKFLKYYFLLTLIFSLPVLAIAQSKDFERVKSELIKLTRSETGPYATELGYTITYSSIYALSAEEYLKQMKEDGSWDDLDYHSTIRNNWANAKHLYRIYLLTKAFSENHNIVFLNKIHQGLNYWMANDFKSGNWWHNQINVPFIFSSILLNLGNHALPAELDFFRQKIVPRISRPISIGQNKIWEQDCFARVALLNNDEKGFTTALNEIKAAVEISTKEGIQPDYSFQQHGTMLQFGNYGLHFVNSLVFWMRVTDATSFEFDNAKRTILLDYCEKGLAHSIYKSKMDITAIGRQLRPNSERVRGEGLNGNFKLIKEMKGVDTSLFQLSGFDMNKSNSQNIDFWRSAYMVQGDGLNYNFSVKTHGKFVERIESINAENSKGSYLNDGVTLLQTSGKEYENIMPFWKWERLPGTTSDTTISVHDKNLSKSSNKSAFVGSISNAKIGISVMDYQRGTISAKKSYFFINGAMLALGSGVKAKSASNLVTDVNQQLIANNKRKWEGGLYKKKQWISYDDKLYYFTGKNQDIEVNLEDRKGNWKDIDAISADKEVQASVLDIYLKHQKEDNYAYWVSHLNNKLQLNLELKTLSDYQIKNNIQIQALKVKEFLMLVCYQSGSFKFGGFNFDIEKPCLILFDTKEKQLWTADPTRSLKEMKLKINKQVLNISLPQGDLLGSTIMAKF